MKKLKAKRVSIISLEVMLISSQNIVNHSKILTQKFENLAEGLIKLAKVAKLAALDLNVPLFKKDESII